VIDWPNVARGPGEADVAHTWIVLACSTPTAGAVRQSVTRAGRELFLRRFLRDFDRMAIVKHIAAAGTFRLETRTLPESELDAIRRMISEVRS